jgi:uncharacterized surface protein with fasciclin (FAS1) repeats
MNSSMKDVNQTLEDMDGFRTLVEVIEDVELSDMLSSPGPFTLFAPIDEAFKKLSEENWKELSRSKWKKKQMLAFHVIADRVTLHDIENMGLAKMMNERIFDIVVKNDGVMLHGARIVQGDIFCSNGVIHAVDSIIHQG